MSGVCAVPSCGCDQPTSPLSTTSASTEARGEADGWIEWSGGECPVSRKTIVGVRFRSFSWSSNPFDEYEGLTAGHYGGHGDAGWRHGPLPTAGDIIAYRVVQP